MLGNNFAFHYSINGEDFCMMRCCHLPAERVVKVGLLAQAPVGNGGARVYEDVTLEARTVKNIRFGV
jgi:regulation of enolase protein 1 (concanavalin A-like superfamily)